MTIYDKIRNEKLQSDINRATAMIYALSSVRKEKHEYLKSVEMLPTQQYKIAEDAIFFYSPLGKVLEKTNKDDGRVGEKQVNVIEDHEEKHLAALNQILGMIIMIISAMTMTGMKIEKIKDF